MNVARLTTLVRGAKAGTVIYRLLLQCPSNVPDGKRYAAVAFIATVFAAIQVGMNLD
jgi:hypothetical protein